MFKNLIQRLIDKLDSFQQKHSAAAFPVAVIKKSGDDKSGYLAALITYYGFLSLFPLLLVATTLLKILSRNNEELRDRFIESVGQYFPIIGNELQGSIHSLNKTGLALASGILLTLYGARGGADALRHAFNQIWDVSDKERLGFPQNLLNSLLLIFVGGGGLVLTSILSGYAIGITDITYLQIISVALSYLLLIGVFYLIFSIGISSTKPDRKDLLISASMAAIGVLILQSAGGYLLTHELKNLSNLYGTFALVLGLLFWIYLQVQVVLLAAEAASVRALKRWPRSLTEN